MRRRFTPRPAWPVISRRRLCLLASATTACRGVAAAAPARFPGMAWDEVRPDRSGWSAPRLAQAIGQAQRLGSTAIVVVQHGVIVASWGEASANILLNSARKSLLSALIGIAAARGQIHLTDTLAQLGIDDMPPALTAAEKRATVRDLLEARSGIYHAANYETQEMQTQRPARGSHAPGTYWFYNNWDFNALGAIYEHAVGAPIFTAFARQIATPTGMQDFDPAQCRYVDGAASRYPAYLFHASARDLARFGLLFLRQGRWGDRQIIPAAWVRESTQPWFPTTRRTGYGYLWWTLAPDGPSRVQAPPGTFWAEGQGGQIVFVAPADDIVVVHLARDHLGRRGVSVTSALRLMELILAARPGA